MEKQKFKKKKVLKINCRKKRIFKNIKYKADNTAKCV